MVMNLVMVDVVGWVSLCIVLFKGVDEWGFCFFINYQSDKGSQLEEYLQVVLNFYWKGVCEGVQVWVEGLLCKLFVEELDVYFVMCVCGSQIGVWVLLQLQILFDCEIFEQCVVCYEQEFESYDVLCLLYWGGFVVELDMVEFWYGVEFCLYECVCWSCYGQIWMYWMLYF